MAEDKQYGSGSIVDIDRLTKLKAKVKAEIQPSVDIKKIDKDGITFEFTFIGKPEVKNASVTAKILNKYEELKIKSCVIF